MTWPLNGGAAFAGKSGRKTANACDTNAREMSADTTAQFILLAEYTLTEAPLFFIKAILLAAGNLFFYNNFFCQKICRKNPGFRACRISRSFSAYLLANSDGQF